MISVIISTYNSEKYILTCLEAVFKSRDVDFEVVVVDAGSREADNNYNVYKSYNKYKNFNNYKIYNFKKNVGLTVSHNKGAGMARGEILLFLDVDTKIDSKALFEIEKFFEKNKEAGAIQGKIETMGHFLSPFGFPYEVRMAGGQDRSEQSVEIFGARTACMAVRKGVFEKVGGFDEDYFMHGEETDLSWRIWLAGYRIYYLPKVKCIHYGKSHYKQDNKMIGYSEQSNRAYDGLFYEGAKNQITTILKDAPPSILIWMLPLNILGWMVVGIKSPWVYKGIGRAFLDLKKTMKKRKKIMRINEKETREIMFGNISFFDLVKKGAGWLKSV